MQAVRKRDDENDRRRDPRQKIDILAKQPHPATKPDDSQDGGNCSHDDEGNSAEEDPAQQQAQTNRDEPESALVPGET
jgi:hypothetical protein